MTYPYGRKYTGQWKNDVRDGQGTLSFPDGKKYVGQFKDNKQHGNGTLYNGEGKVIREGMWENDKFIGGE